MGNLSTVIGCGVKYYALKKENSLAKYIQGIFSGGVVKYLRAN